MYVKRWGVPLIIGGAIMFSGSIFGLLLFGKEKCVVYREKWEVAADRAWARTQGPVLGSRYAFGRSLLACWVSLLDSGVWRTEAEQRGSQKNSVSRPS